MTRQVRLSLVWLVFATLVTFTAVWQVQVQVVRDLRQRQQLPPPPAKTRHAPRPPAVAAAVDPVADYIKRCRKGLTNREIGWIAGDFQNAGLDAPVRAATREEYLRQRAGLQRWYLAALADGLHLEKSQISQAAAALGERFGRDKADFIEALAAGPRPFQHNGKWYGLTSAEPIRRLLDARRWPAPWELCELMPAQAEIGWKSSAPSPDDRLSFLLEGPWKADRGGATGLVPERFLGANAVFPLLVAQQFTALENPADLLAKLRLLHPAQARTLLLFEPEMAREIVRALDGTEK